MFNQCDNAWAKHLLGWGGQPGTICQYGCYDAVLAFILASTGHVYNPATFDELLTARRIFARDPTGTYDYMPDNALDQLFPGEFKTQVFVGYRPDLIKAAIPTPNVFVVLHISGVYSPLWKMVVATHYMLGWTADGAYVGDPQGGVVRALSAYGSAAAAVKQTILVTYTKPAPKPATPPVVTPAPPVAVPAPPELFSTVVGNLFVATPRPYDAAMKLADDYAHLHVGTMVEVRDKNDKTVGTAFYAPDPQPIPAGQAIALPTPLPGQSDWAGILQNLLIAVLLALRYFGQHQGSVQKRAA